MASVRVKYVIEWETEVLIPEGCGDIQKYSRNIAVEILNDQLQNGDFFNSPNTEVKSIDFTYIGKKFPIGKGWSLEQTRLIASAHGYEHRINQNPFEVDDARYKVYEKEYKAGLNER